MSAEKKAGLSFPQPNHATVTKAERDVLIAGRPKPVLEPHLTPGGVDEVVVKQVLETARENRINQIQARLDQAHDGLRQAHSKAMVRGRAKTDFDRER